MSKIITCDECGQSVSKIHRRYKERGYCSNCYTKVFIKRKCPGCSLFARLPKDDNNAICTKCEIKKPCVRCNISGKPVGKITLYGVVCASCTPYFRPKQSCEICGRLSSRLTRVKRFGDQLRRCERCARADHRTCPSCQRHRRLYYLNGKELCNSCHTGKLKQCIKCNNQIPMAYGQLCKQCYWIEHLEKRLAINQTMLKSKQLKDDLSKFAQWLAQQYGFLKASLVIGQHSVFFKKVDDLWESFPNYSKLVTKLGTSNLKEHKRILMWLEAEKDLVIDKNLKKNLTEEQYIRKMLADIPNTSKIKPHILKYEKFLRVRALQKQNSIRTIRYSLTPAIALMKMTLVNNGSLPNQKILAKYLQKSPGQKASLTLFLTFLKKEYKLDFNVPHNLNTEQIRRTHIEKKLIKLARNYNDWNQEKYFRWYQYSFEFFHGLRIPLKIIKKMQIKQGISTEGIFMYYLNNKYFIPLPRE